MSHPEITNYRNLFTLKGFLLRGQEDGVLPVVGLGPPGLAQGDPLPVGAVELVGQRMGVEVGRDEGLLLLLFLRRYALSVIWRKRAVRS